MKLNIEVDLSDLVAEYNEDDGATLKDEIVNAITHKVKHHVLDTMRKDTIDNISVLAKEAIESERVGAIQEMIRSAIHSQKVKKRYSSNDMITFADYIKEELERTHLSDGTVRDFLNKVVKETSNKIGDELKQRYDLLFATQIVAKLHEQGMLKNEVASVLLGDKPQG